MKNISITLFTLVMVMAFFGTPWHITTSLVYAQDGKNLSPTYKTGVRFWDWDSIPESLQNKIEEINPEEGNDTYAFKEGAVSRNVGPYLMSLFEDGITKSIQTVIRGEIRYPGMVGKATRFIATPRRIKGDLLTFWHRRIERRSAMDPSSKLFARIYVPPRCEVKYPRLRKDGTHWFDTRTSPRGDPSELAISAHKGARGMYLNAIIKCPKKPVT